MGQLIRPALPPPPPPPHYTHKEVLMWHAIQIYLEAGPDYIYEETDKTTLPDLGSGVPI